MSKRKRRVFDYAAYPCNCAFEDISSGELLPAITCKFPADMAVCASCGWNPAESARRLTEGRWVKCGKGSRKLVFPARNAAAK